MKKRKVLITFFRRNDGKSFNRKEDGFTFVETLAVLAVSTVLAAGAGISASKCIEIAKSTAARNQIEQFKVSLQAYYLDCGSFPTEEQGLESLWQKPVLYPVPENWNGPYVARKIPCDPWGTDFTYMPGANSAVPDGTPENIPFVIISYGSDKKEGGSGTAEDVISWH